MIMIVKRLQNNHYHH